MSTIITDNEGCDDIDIIYAASQTKTQLVWITQDAQEIIAKLARVSNPQNENNTKTAPKLLQYLIKHHHWSPFEMASMCIEIFTTRAIAAQILRHRSFSFQEFCVAEGTYITYIDTFGKRKVIEIEKLYNNYDNVKLPVYDEITKTFVETTIKEVFNTGIKQCFEVKLDSGKSIQSTDKHKYFELDKGFVELFNLKEGDYIAVNVNDYCKFEKIISINSVGLKQTYDIEVTHNSHNYVANGIVSHNSQRFASATDMEYELPYFRLQDHKNRQSSLDDIDLELQKKFQSRTKTVLDSCFVLYNDLLKEGVAKECARMVLPLCTRTRMYMTGTIRSWIHYIQLRSAWDTQVEHRIIAEKAKEILINHMPWLEEVLQTSQ